MLRGAFPPKIDKGKYIILAAGGTYRSQAFSGSGWRFGGIGVKPADGTGHFLRWKSYIDDGRVGNINQATTTKGGVLVEGLPLYAREGFKYFVNTEDLSENVKKEVLNKYKIFGVPSLIYVTQ